MWLVIGLIKMVEHIKEIFNIAEVFRRHVVLTTGSVSVRVGSNGRHQTQKSVDLLISGQNVLVDLLSSQCRVGLWFESRVG
jgi:hypothetical protein